MDLLKRQFRHPPGYYWRLLFWFVVGAAVTLFIFAFIGAVGGQLDNGAFIKASLITPLGVGFIAAYLYDSAHRKA
jgi:hypothetical protein